MKKPVLLNFAESDFRRALNEKQSLIEELNQAFAECAKLLKRELTEDECKAIIAAPEEYLTEELTKNVSIDGIELSAKKILELKEINLAPIVNTFTKTRDIFQDAEIVNGVYALPNSYVEEMKKNYQSYATTDAQIALANSLMNLYAAFKEVEKNSTCTLFIGQLQNATNGLLSFPLGTMNEPKILPHRLYQSAKELENA